MTHEGGKLGSMAVEPIVGKRDNERDKSVFASSCCLGRRHFADARQTPNPSRTPGRPSNPPLFPPEGTRPIRGQWLGVERKIGGTKSQREVNDVSGGARSTAWKFPVTSIYILGHVKKTLFTAGPFDSYILGRVKKTLSTARTLGSQLLEKKKTSQNICRDLGTG
uniref:Uncharacterized protein n=1 Tax=Steinernema glaseri TaxID=37863 RepID=A0A1I7XXP3_9BILA